MPACRAQLGRKLSRRLVIGGSFGTASSLLGNAPEGLPFGLARSAGARAVDRTAWLVGAHWLRERRTDPGVRVVALVPPEEFDEGHVPGAVQVDWPAFEVTDTSDASITRWQAQVEQLLTELGLSATDTIVVYDGGTLYAPRLWWVLKQLGHDDVRVLNGGFQAWRSVGTVDGGSVWVGSGEGTYRADPDPTRLATLTEVEASLDDPNVVLVDARSADEYAAGHIPGAVNVEFTRNAEPNPPRYWRPDGELREMYGQLGVVPERRVVTYCTTGVRAAVAYFTLDLLGFRDLALFTGSWQEWSADPERPVTTGLAP